jgi:hypothetical protein
MNAFYEHHTSSIEFVYRCFDRILLNGLIQRCVSAPYQRGIPCPEKCGLGSLSSTLSTFLPGRRQPYKPIRSRRWPSNCCTE